MREYWEQLLRGTEYSGYTPFSMPDQTPDPHVEYRFSEAESAQIQSVCRNLHVTESLLFLCAFGLALGYLTDSEVPAMYFSAPESYETGFPVRFPADAACFADYLNAVGKQLQASAENDFYPYAADAPDLLNETLLDMQFVYTESDAQMYLPEFFTPHTVFCGRSGSAFRLIADMQGTNAQRKHLLHVIANYVRAICKNPDAELQSAEPEDADEIARILQQYNHTLPEQYPDYLGGVIFSHRDAEHAARTAIIYQNDSITYGALYQAVEQIASALRDQQYRRIALLTDKCVYMPVLLLAMIRAGISYVPVDPKLPETRIRAMLELTGPDAWIVQKKYADIAEKESFTAAYDMNALPDDYAVYTPQKSAEYEDKPADELCVLFTSGTTGVPKGVRLLRRNVNAYVYSFLQEFRLTKDSVVLQQATYGFDTFIEETFPTLAVGGTLVLADKNMVLDFPALCSELTRRKVSLVSCSPLMLNELNRYLQDSSLTCAISGGDVLKPQYYDNLKNSMQIYNTYGPTETTVCAAYHNTAAKVPQSVAGSCIGKPIACAKIYIMRGQRLCGTYVPGEILIGGDGVTAGYIGAGEQTASRFLPDPFSDGRIYRTGDVGMWLEDGSIQFLGRHDRQIKLRSFRIELPEIEQAANSAFVLKEAEAVYFCDLEKIALFYVPDDAQSIPADAIRSHLKSVLPAYMVPAEIIVLKRLPRTINDKLDLKALRKEIKHET